MDIKKNGWPNVETTVDRCRDSREAEDENRAIARNKSGILHIPATFKDVTFFFLNKWNAMGESIGGGGGQWSRYKWTGE